MPTLASFFDRIYVINLPERTDRRKAIGRELSRLGVGFDNPAVELFAAARERESRGFPSPAVRGCFLSHLTILRAARERKLKNVLILEDDLAISPLISQHLQSLLGGLDHQSWDFLYLGHIETLASWPEPRLIPYDGPVETAHFYAVNSAVFEPLIECLEKMQTREPGDPRGGPMHYDGALSTFRAQNSYVRTLISQPNLGWQRSSRSDIHGNWYDRVTGLRRLADFARSLRQRIRDFGSASADRSRPLSSTEATQVSEPLPEITEPVKSDAEPATRLVP